MSKQQIDRPIAILNIGTEILVKDVMDQYLRSLGDIKTYYASSMGVALDTFRRQKINIVFSELSFKAGSAEEFIREIGGLDVASDLFFVLASAEDSPAIHALKSELNIDEFLHKPFSSKEVETIVHKALQKEERKKQIWMVDLLEAKDAEKNKRFQEAELRFQKLQEVKSPTKELQIEIAGYLLRKSRYKAAIEILEQVLAVDKTNVSAMHYLGEAYLRGGDVSSGLEYLEKAQNLSPLNMERALLSATAYLSNAHDVARSALEINEENPKAHLMIAKIKIFQRQYGPAASYLEQKKNIFVIPEDKKEMEAYLAFAKKLGGFQ